MHHDQEAIYNDFIEFQKINEGVEVTEADLLDAWRAAKKQTNYFAEEESEKHGTKQEVHVYIKLTTEMDLNADISTDIIAGLQVFEDILTKPVEIMNIKEEAEIYDL